MLNALTIDVEDYYQVTAFEQAIPRSSWGDYESRVVRNTERLLELFELHDATATFYILGWVAERFPGLVRRIHEAGHELGSHSYWHRLIYQLEPREVREDLIKSCDAIQDVSGVKVKTFRAPSFSITKRSLWAFEVLAELGFEIDSSVYPTAHDRYGIRDANRNIHRVETVQGELWEFPMTSIGRGPLTVPISGGGYFRLYPIKATLKGLHSVNLRGKPFVFYLHPWEIDPLQPRLPHGSSISRWRHYVNLASTEAKLTRLLQSFDFASVSRVVSQHNRDESNGHRLTLDVAESETVKDL